MKPEPVTEHVVKSKLRQGLEHSHTQAAEVSDLIRKLTGVGHVALFGGALRDWAFSGPNEQPRDLDLVVHSTELRDLDSILKRYSPTRNNFGGYRVLLQSCPLDIWLLKDTFALRKCNVHRRGLGELPWTTFFNTDAIAMDLESNEVYAEPQFYEAYKHRILDINHGENPNRVGCLARAIRLAEKYNLQIAPRLLTYMSGVADETPKQELEKVSTAIWRQRVDLDPVLAEIRQRAKARPSTPERLLSKAVLLPM